MKKFFENHVMELVGATAVLLIALVSLSVFLFFSFRAEAEISASTTMLDRAELRSMAENLQSALNAGDGRLSYHYAASAAEKASRAGDHDAAALFRRMADSLLAEDGAVTAMQQALEQYLESGEAPDFSTITDASDEKFMSDEDVHPVSAYSIEIAEKCLERMFGNHNTLRRGMKSRNGELLFSCSNAYAVIDERTGLPIEAAISLSPAEIRLTADECVDSAMMFLEEFFPGDIAASTDVRNIKADNSAGTFEIYCVSQNRQLVLSVRRDNGRVARLMAR